MDNAHELKTIIIFEKKEKRKERTKEVGGNRGKLQILGHKKIMG